MLLGGERRVYSGQAKTARVSCVSQLEINCSFLCDSEVHLLHLSSLPALFSSLICVHMSPSVLFSSLGMETMSSAPQDSYSCCTRTA